MTHDVRLMVCHNIGLYVYTKTAYRRTDKVNKVNKGSGGVGEGGVGESGWQNKNGRAKNLV